MVGNLACCAMVLMATCFGQTVTEFAPEDAIFDTAVIVEEEVVEETVQEEIIEEYNTEYVWSGSVLTPSSGVNYGPSGKETYYNLPMETVVMNMRYLGYDEYAYPYWIRDDGCKMLGDYIMVAAHLDHRPKGTIVETSLGTGIVCDTGSFVYTDTYQIDIAVSW